MLIRRSIPVSTGDLTHSAPPATIVARVYHCHFLLSTKNVSGSNAALCTYVLVDNLDKDFSL